MRILALVCILVLGGCQADDRRATEERAVASRSPAQFSFQDTARLLEEREILIAPLEENKDVLTSSEFKVLLEKRMDRHSSWQVLSTHLAEMNMPNEHFKIYDQPTYVVEITGPSTGNCFDFYVATDGDYHGSACFYPTRG